MSGRSASRQANRKSAMRRDPLYIEDILRWARQYHTTAGRWPTEKSGPIAGTDGETWDGVDEALFEGLRGLAGGSSLARLLTARCGARPRGNLPPLTEDQILGWADAHHRR